MINKVRNSNTEILFEEVEQIVSQQKLKSPPRIGISVNRKDGLSCVAETYIRSIVQAGGVPIMIPAITDIDFLESIVKILDGIIITGGGDINPLYIDEQPIPQLQDIDSFRDEYDLLLLKLAELYQLPLLGICRGHQIVNVAFGGSIYQDISSQYEYPIIKHSQNLSREFASHSVFFTKEDSKLKRIFADQKELKVNSFHHQAVKKIAPDFIETAVSSDGINEAIEHKEKPIWGIQWHPEAMAASGDTNMMKIFNQHIADACLFSKAKNIHKRIITLDSHTDTPMLFKDDFNVSKIQKPAKVNLPYMNAGHIDATYMVAYIPQGKLDEDSLAKATDYATQKILQIKKQEQLNPDQILIAQTTADLLRAKTEQKKALLIGIENGYAIGKDLENINKFKDLGVSYITLCHNGDNDICDSAKGEQTWNGISPFGKQVIDRMNQTGLIVDISHSSEKTFYDAISYSKKPIVASHSSARSLCNHPRNLTDDQLKEIAAHDGVVQVCLYEGFINQKTNEASVSDAVKHIQHMVDIMGIDHVGIGSDFDGGGELIGCRNTSDLIQITMHLIANGFTEKDLAKIWGGNWMRVMDKVQS